MKRFSLALSVFMLLLTACGAINLEVGEIKKDDVNQVAGNIYAGILVTSMARKDPGIKISALKIFGELKRHLDVAGDGKIDIEGMFGAVKIINPKLDHDALELCQQLIEANIGDIHISIDEEYQQFFHAVKQIVGIVHEKLLRGAKRISIGISRLCETTLLDIG